MARHSNVFRRRARFQAALAAGPQSWTAVMKRRCAPRKAADMAADRALGRSAPGFPVFAAGASAAARGARS
ncbi:MAG: hypothetical protein ACJAVS_001108 [Paracoccaceae bacterium]|jgi:hypothetical protein